MIRKAFCAGLAFGLWAGMSPAHAQIMDFEGYMGNVFPEDAQPDSSQEADTIIEGLKLAIGSPMAQDGTVKVYSTDRVLFVPLDATQLTPLVSFTVASDSANLRGTIKAVRLGQGDDGRYNELTPLTAVGVGANAEGLIALPSGTTHLELAVSAAADFALRIPPTDAAPETPTLKLGAWTQFQGNHHLDIPAPYPLKQEDGTLLQPRLSALLPGNFKGTVIYHFRDGRMELPMVGYPTRSPIPNAGSDLQRVELRLERNESFNGQGWPAVPLRLDYAEVTFDEREPNENAPQSFASQWIAGDKRTKLTGYVTNRSPDHWLFMVDEDREVTGQQFTVDFGRARGELALLDDAGEVLTARSGDGKVTLRDVVLPVGRYHLRVISSGAYTPYALTLKSRKPPKLGEETEPNDQFAYAIELPLDTNMSGTAEQEQDFYRVFLPDPGHLYSVQASGGPHIDIVLDSGTIVQSAPSNRDGGLTNLSNISLPSGAYYVGVRDARKYRLIFRDQGPAPSGFEQEPNDSIFNTRLIALGETMRGILDGPTLRDGAAFSVATPQYVRLRIKAPDDAVMRANLFHTAFPMFNDWTFAPGSETDQTFFLEAGDYRVDLWQISEATSKDLWSISLLPPDFSPPFEAEPNQDTPIRLSPGQMMAGSAGGIDPTDGFIMDLPQTAGDIYYNCAQGPGGSIDVGISPKGADWRAGLRGMGVQAEGVSFPHPGGADAQLVILKRADQVGDYSCAARFKTAQTSDAVLSGKPVQHAPSAAWLGQQPGDDIPLPARLRLSVTDHDQRFLRLLSVPDGADLLALKCNAPDGRDISRDAVIATSNGEPLPFGTAQDAWRIVPVTGAAPYFLGFAPHMLRPDQPLTCDLAIVDATGAIDMANAAPVSLNAEPHRVGVTGSTKLRSAAAPGRLWEHQRFEIQTDRPTTYDVACMRENAPEDRFERRFGVFPDRPVHFDTHLGRDLDTAATIDCTFLDLSDLPALPLGETTGGTVAATPSFSEPPPNFAALHPMAQKHVVPLQIDNPADHPLELQITTQITARGWAVHPHHDVVTLPAGESTLVPLDVIAPAYASPMIAPDILVQVAAANGPVGRADMRLKLDINAPASDPHPYWQTPSALAGGLNVGWEALGAQIIAGGDRAIHDDAPHFALHDRNAPRKEPHHIDGAKSITFDLAGDAPVPLAGVAATLRYQAKEHSKLPKALRVEVSGDGQNFKEAGVFDFTSLPSRQYFVFDTPQTARFVRVSDPQCTDHRHCLPLSEIAFIAEPGWALQADGFNVAQPSLGGLMIGANTLGGDNYQSILITGDRAGKEPLVISPEELEEGEPIPENAGTHIIGFFRARAPQITHIVWSNLHTLHDQVPYADVSIGMRPTQPDTYIGRIEKPEDGGTSKLTFPEGTQARYVFLTYPYAEHRQSAPAHIEVFERPHSADYMSILGMWDEDDRRGFAQWQARHDPVPPPAEVMTVKDVPLPPNTPHSAVTQKESPPNWYDLPPQPGMEQAFRLITLAADQVVEVGPTLLDQNGQEIPLERVQDFLQRRADMKSTVADAVAKLPQGGDQVTYIATVDPAQAYRLKISEDGRLLIIRREISPMLANSDTVRRRAYLELAELMGDGQDAISVGIADRSGNMLLRGREDILFGINRTRAGLKARDAGTSDLAEALAQDAALLRNWRGGKGIVYFGTGAAMAGREDMRWPFVFGDVPARSSTVHIPCDDGNFFCPDPFATDMYPMHFAAAMNGRFFRTLSNSDARDGLLNAAHALTGPKYYTVAWTDIDAPPAPARISLEDMLAGVGKDLGAVSDDPPALALVLDASGSMLKRMNGTRRIAIAKTALNRLVDEVIPDQTHVTFRAFGLAKDGCMSEERFGLGPLNRPALKSAINAVEAINLARTPIAKSLQAAAADLGQGDSTRAIVLLTDGEETCDGSIEDALRNIRDAGVQVELNIVGFAVKDAELEADFTRHAESTGGAYFSALDADALDAAIAEAVSAAILPPQPQFAQITRHDADQDMITLPFGDKVALPPGDYHLRTDLGQTLRLTLSEGQDIALTAQDFEDAP